MLDAAMAGQRLALTSDVRAERALRAGRLVRLFDVQAASPWTYHMVTRPEDRDTPHVHAFREWIVAAMAAGRRSA